MNKLPLVSIGLPVLNGEKYIKYAVDSILNQTYLKIELIISINFSNDTTNSIVEKLKSKYKWIKVYKHKSKISLPENFDFVLKKANGEFFMWFAHDDCISRNYILNSVNFLSKYKDCCVVQSKIETIRLPSRKKIQTICFANQEVVFDPRIIIKNLMSEKKFNYYFYGLFRSDILKNGYNFCNIKSSDRIILLQYAIGEYRFGYLVNCTYYRGIHKMSALERYPDDEIELKIAKQKWILNFFEAFNFFLKMIEKQNNFSIDRLKTFKFLILLFLFFTKRQIILILRYFKMIFVKYVKKFKLIK